MSEFSHLDKHGNVKMVDVTDKMTTARMAKAEGKISILPETILAIQDVTLPKGNVLTTAKIAGIQAAKKTAELIPMCHQLNLSFVDIEFDIQENAILIKSTVKTKEATGVEMEALLAVSGTALTIYDMCKAVDKTMVIGEIQLVEKVGGKSDHATEYRPKVGVITLSDSVASGKSEDISGVILLNGFIDAGCTVIHHEVFPDGSNELVPLSGWSDLFICPGYKFRLVQAMVTNFHLPRSTLLMLVSAFAGWDQIFKAYEEAIRQNYRFYSFGDCMIIT